MKALVIVVVAFAVSLPVMCLMNGSNLIEWNALGAVAEEGEEKEDKDNPAVDILCLKGLASAGEGKHDKAIAAYSAAIDLDPNYSFSYIGRGDVYLAKGDVESALRDYDQAVRLDPTNDTARERADLVRRHQEPR